MKLEIVKRQNWAGVVKYSRSQEILSPALSSKNGKHITGLTKEEEELYEMELGLKRGELRPGSSYWDNFSITIPMEGIDLEVTTPLDEMMVKFLKSHPLVAPTYSKRYDSSLYRYVLVDEEEVAELSVKVRSVKAEAFSEFNNMSTEQVINTLKVLGYKTDQLSYAQRANILGGLIETDPAKFLEVVKDGSLLLKVVVVDALNKGIFTKTKGKIEVAPIFYQDTLIGEGLEDAAKNLSSNKLQGTLIAVRQLLSKKEEFVMSDTAKEVTALVTAQSTKKKVLTKGVKSVEDTGLDSDIDYGDSEISH